VLFGIACILAKLSAFLIIPLFFFILRYYFINKEERVLFEIFGADYSRYCYRVRRWI
jgi:protein-S-isoprenylcysteine O-methyltransferase Ste14